MSDEDENEYYDARPFPEKIVIQELIEIIYECKSLLDTKLDNYCSRRMTHKTWFINTKHRCKINNRITLDKFINYYIKDRPVYTKENLKKLIECCAILNDGYTETTNTTLLFKCLKDNPDPSEKVIDFELYIKLMTDIKRFLQSSDNRLYKIAKNHIKGTRGGRRKHKTKRLRIKRQ
jgi:hypothetical protein